MTIWCGGVVVENHVTHRPSPSFHSTLAKTPSSPIAPAEKKNVWHRHCWQLLACDELVLISVNMNSFIRSCTGTRSFFFFFLTFSHYYFISKIEDTITSAR